MKKIVSVIAAVTMVALWGTSNAFAAKTKSNEGKELNIVCWNEEFQSRFRKYYEEAGKLPSDVKVNWLITPNQGNAYQNKLDELLMNQEYAQSKDKIDLFLVEADYALKYVNSDFLLSIKEIGLTDADLKDQYQYTKDVMTDAKGTLKGVTWQACPGGFIYRRSIALGVLGTDEPDEVQKYLSDWDKFDKVAQRAKDKGYFMLSGFDDAYRVFSDNVTSPCVIKNKINVDPQINRWIRQTKTYTEKGFNNKANLWSNESFKGAARTGKVFGYFGPAWFIDFCLAPATLDNPKAPKEKGNGSYGDWAFCKGPQSFSWGGTWICAAKGSDNVGLIKDIMKTLTCDKTTMIKIAKEDSDFVNNAPAMAEVAASDYKNPFLGGQNHIAIFLDAAKSISKANMTPYDQGYNEKMLAAMADYYNGLVTEEQAWNNFRASLRELYPGLRK